MKSLLIKQVVSSSSSNARRNALGGLNSLQLLLFRQMSTQPKKLVEQQTQVQSNTQKAVYKVEKEDNPLAEFWTLKTELYIKDKP